MAFRWAVGVPRLLIVVTPVDQSGRSTLFPSRHRVAALFEPLGLKALGLVEIAGHLPNASGCRSSRMRPRDEGGFEVY